MMKQQNEIKMIWLMILMIAAIVGWIIDIPVLTFLCVVALIISVMLYVNSIEQPVNRLEIQSDTPQQRTSRLPLYVSSFVALVGSLLDVTWLVGLGLTVWIYFFLNWLRRLEYRIAQLNLTQQQIIHKNFDRQTVNLNNARLNEDDSAFNAEKNFDFKNQIYRWLFQGNPVLKIAITVLVIGIILLLRFVVEHWLFNLAFKLAGVAAVSMLIVGVGYWIQDRNRGFSLALQGLGLSGLFLSILFAYHSIVLSFTEAFVGYAFVMIMMIALSLKQKAIELSVMATLIAYVAPFTLPVHDFSSVQLLSYYLVVNLAVAAISTVQPWKILNQIALILIICFGAGYALVEGYSSERLALSVLTVAHALIFIWLGFRFHQLEKNQTRSEQTFSPWIDSALIFVSPLIAYAFIYLMYVNEIAIQIGFSLAFSLLYLGLYKLSKLVQLNSFAQKSYFSLIFIFLSFIPPILLPSEWTVIGWVTEGLLILYWALRGENEIARSLAFSLLALGGISYFYYLVELPSVNNIILWILAFAYILAIVLSNFTEKFQRQLVLSDKTFMAVFSFFASIFLLRLGLEEFAEPYRLVTSLSMTVAIYYLANYTVGIHSTNWSWLLPKWLGLVPMLVVAIVIPVDQYHLGVVSWQSGWLQAVYAIACGLLGWMWLTPLANSLTENEWVSFGGLLSLALASVALFSQIPVISLMVLPLSLCAYSAFKADQKFKNIWLSKSSLILFLIWIVVSQLFAYQPFKFYYIPLLNPLDLISLGVLMGFVWMLRMQLEAGLEKALALFFMLLTVLWLSSYILLRAMHFYLDTPYNQIEIWRDSLVQLSLTLLWVIIAFVVMKYSAYIQQRTLWLFGASVLAIVTVKLVLFDLSNIGTLNRVMSFLGAGFIMLIISYIAPSPQLGHKTKNQSVE